MLTQVNLLLIQQHTAASARNRNGSVLFSLTHGEGVVDTETAKDSVHITGMKESVPSNYRLKSFWNRGNALCLMLNTCCVLNIYIYFLNNLLSNIAIQTELFVQK